MCSAASMRVFFTDGKGTIDILPIDAWIASGGQGMSRDSSSSQTEVIVTRAFLQNWLRLSSKKQARIRQKIDFLVQNHRHPSLRTHQLHRSGREMWSCSLSKTERLLYSRCGCNIVLHAVGSHAVVDNAHIRRFSISDEHLSLETDYLSILRSDGQNFHLLRAVKRVRFPPSANNGSALMPVLPPTECARFRS
jgi:mRNA-degrading endonuclease YafQ of YafQ-DinJ toxin-antitoxin module